VSCSSAGRACRFGSPKALARFGGETLAERAWRLLGEACGERIAVGKAADGLDLPFELLCDPSAEAYRGYGLVRGNAYQVAMAPQVVAAGIKAAAEGHFISATVGDAMQLPGSFVVVDGRIVYAHRGRLSSDLAPIDDLLQAVRQAT